MTRNMSFDFVIFHLHLTSFQILEKQKVKLDSNLNRIFLTDYTNFKALENLIQVKSMIMDDKEITWSTDKKPFPIIFSPV